MKYKTMKKFTMIAITALLVMSFMSISAFAQELNSGITNNELTNQEVNSGINPAPANPEASPELTNQGDAQDVNNQKTDARHGMRMQGIRKAVTPNQKVNSGVNNQVVNPTITNKEVNSDKSTKELKSKGDGIDDLDERDLDASQGETLSPRQQLIKYEWDYDDDGTWEYDKASPLLQLALNELDVKPSEIFSPVLSSVKNLVVKPTIKNKKVIYELKAKDVNKPIFSDKEVVRPIFDLRIDEPVEFKLTDKKIIVNDEQIIDLNGIIDIKEDMPYVESEIQSTLKNRKIYNLKIAPGIKSAKLNFLHKEKEVVMPIYSDFKIENKKLYLLENNKPYDLKINPPEIYSAVYDLKVKEPKIVIKNLALKMENNKPIYDLRVKQPAKILWIIPWTVKSKYVINPTDGSTKLVDSPWYVTSEKIGAFFDVFVVIE